jgi:predicted nucleic acid-binding protein
MVLVVDASVVGCWCFPDQANPMAEVAFGQLAVTSAVVPALWWFEVRNLLLVNERRGRLDAVGTAEFLADLGRLPIQIDRERDGDAIIALARAHRLTFYDAAYLELARRLDAPLATLERGLAAAARAAAVSLLDEDQA